MICLGIIYDRLRWEEKELSKSADARGLDVNRVDAKLLVWIQIGVQLIPKISLEISSSKDVLAISGVFILQLFLKVKG